MKKILALALGAISLSISAYSNSYSYGTSEPSVAVAKKPNVKEFLITSSSMFPLFHTGSKYEFKQKKRSTEINRGDVVAFKIAMHKRFKDFKVTSECNLSISLKDKCIQTHYVSFTKRIIGIPGDNIKIDGLNITINGEKLKYKKSSVSDETVKQGDVELSSTGRKTGFNYQTEHYPDTDATTVIAISKRYKYNEQIKIDTDLGQDEYFVLGDNRVFSLDSRVFGAIYDNEISRVYYDGN